MMDVRPALVLFTAVLAACGPTAMPAAKLPPPQLIQNADVETDLEAGQSDVSMEIIELMCSPCAAQIVSHSRLLPGVTKVSMVLATKTLIVRYDSGLTSRDAVVASVEEIVANIQ